MTISPRRASWLAFAAGVAATLLFAGPLLGAVWGSLTIDRNVMSAGNTPRAAAYRLYTAVGLRHYAAVDMDRPVSLGEDATDCEVKQSGNFARNDPGLLEAIGTLNWAVDFQSGYISITRRADAVIEQIRSFSSPILGGLEGCLNASLLAPLCERVIRRIERQALKSDDLRRDLARNDAETERVWFLLAEHLVFPKMRPLTVAQPVAERSGAPTRR